MASNNPMKAFIGSPKKADITEMTNQQTALRNAVAEIVDKVIKGGENATLLVMDKQEDQAFRDEAGPLAIQLGDKVRQVLAKHGKI